MKRFDDWNKKSHSSGPAGQLVAAKVVREARRESGGESGTGTGEKGTPFRG